MDEREWLTERFEQHRPHLRAVAYRMLGSVSESDDALQEAWLRVRDQDPGDRSEHASLADDGRRPGVSEHAARAAGRAARSSRCSSRIPWSASRRMTSNTRRYLAESVGLALLVVLDALTPSERLAFVLHDVFGVPFADIAAALDRSEAAAQQLASRARGRVRHSPEPDRDLARQRRVVDAFFAASRDGEFDALLEVLDPDVDLSIDGGVLRAEASLALHGADAVATHTATYSKLYPFVRPALVNGAAGAVVAPPGGVFSVMAFTVTNGKIAQIDVLLDPHRLEQLDLRIPPAAGKHG